MDHRVPQKRRWTPWVGGAVLLTVLVPLSPVGVFAADEPAAEHLFLPSEDTAATAPEATVSATISADDLRQVLEREGSMALDPSAACVDTGPRGEGGADGAAAPEGEPKAPTGDGPPIPLYTVEGTGGCLIVPWAYLINRGPPGTKVGVPSAGFTFVKIGKTKNVQQFAMTETFFRRIEVGYSFANLALGNFKTDVRNMFGVDIGDNVMMHSFNLRGLLIEETPTIPAVTAGVTFKYTDGIKRIDRRLGGALTALGVERANGTDFTLHATKMFPKLGFGRPVIVNGGIRFSQAAQLGLLGFGDAYRLTGEGSVACLVTDWMAIAYEFRQKKDAIGTVGDLVRGEDNWHTVCLAFILNEHLAVACGWGHFGAVANEVEDGVWGFQVKYEF